MTQLEHNQFLDRLEQAGALDEIQGLILDLRDQLGIAHVVYHWVSADGEQFGYGTYNPVWVQHYIDQDYLRVDPVILGCFQRFHPVDWQSLDWSTRPARQFREDAIAHGVGNQGFSIPIRGPNGQFALFTVSHHCDDDTWRQFTLDNQRDLILIAYYLNKRSLQLHEARLPERLRPLSPRETDVLTFLAMGYNRSQSAELLHISEHTLRAYVESARLKLDATNTIHAVARAVTEGLIVIGGSARAAPGEWPGHDQIAPTDA